MSKATSRRALLAGAASLPALAVPAATACVSQSADAELIELGRRLGASWPEHARLCRESLESSHRIWVATRDAAGIPFSVRYGHPDLEHLSRTQRGRVYDAWEATHKASNPDHAELDAQYRRTDDLMAQIARLPATTVAGLAAKAVAAAHANRELWECEEGGLDWDRRPVRDLIDAVLAAAGVANLTREHSTYVDMVDEVPPAPKEVDRVLEVLDNHQAAKAEEAAVSKELDTLDGQGLFQRPAWHEAQARFDRACSREVSSLHAACLAKPANRLTGGIQAKYLARAFGQDLGSFDNYDIRPAIVTLLRNVGEVMLPDEDMDELLAKYDDNGEPRAVSAASARLLEGVS